MKEIALTPPTRAGNKNKNIITFSPSIGIGNIEVFDLRYGIRLVVGDYRLNQTTIFKYQSTPSFGFAFCLSGDIEVQPTCLKKSFFIKSGQSGFFSFLETHDCFETISKERVIRVSILMDVDQISSFAAQDSDKFLDTLMTISKASCRLPDKVTPAMRIALNQMLECPYHGLTRNLFIESKVMELVAYKIEQLKTGSQHIAKTPSLTSRDIDCVHYAAKLLNRDLGNAPSLIELARLVGMSRSKLHYCFCKVYGITPFNYLRNQRLEAAKCLLNEGKMNITQTAYSVGYSSLSHFAKAFKQYFGSLPCKYQKRSSSLTK